MMRRHRRLQFGVLPLAMCGLTAGHAWAQVSNTGFETAGTTSAQAANWTVTQAVGGPVYGVRTNGNPRGGSFNFEVHVASTGAGPVVEFVQTGIPVIGGATYTFSFYADRLAGSAGDNNQYNMQWLDSNSTVVMQTGYTAYSPGAGVYAQTVVGGLAAPATAATASIFFHTAGAAIPSQSATIDFDDVSLATTNSVSSGGDSTNQLQVAIAKGVGISWFASNGVLYQVRWANTSDTNAVWNNLGNLIAGNGNTNTVMDPYGLPHNCYQVLSIH